MVARETSLALETVFHVFRTTRPFYADNCRHNIFLSEYCSSLCIFSPVCSYCETHHAHLHARTNSEKLCYHEDLAPIMFSGLK